MDASLISIHIGKTPLDFLATLLFGHLSAFDGARDPESQSTQRKNDQPESYPYLFVPPWRYERIQRLRSKGKWTYSDSRSKVINNFGRNFGVLLNAAGIEDKTFHDLRRTALTN